VKSLERRLILKGSLASILGVALLHSTAIGAPDPLKTVPLLGDRWLGQADAPVTMIEYASATCPHCAEFHAKTFPTIKTEYIDTGKVRFAMREFPFDQLSLAAFMLARCAPEERYFDIIDVLFEQQQTWTRNPKSELLKIAKFAGFTERDFESCLKNEEVAKGIITSKNQATSALGVKSTPTFFINGSRLSGNLPIGDYRTLIDSFIS
jgi:protein-disulfide isomerase